MKICIGALVVFFLCFVSCTSLGPDVAGAVEYTEVITIDGMSADDIYTKANMWFVDSFTNADSVIQFSDKESGTIKGKYVAEMIVSSFQQYLVTSIITVEARDGRCRISFTEPFYKQYKVDGFGIRMGGFTGGDLPVKAQVMVDNLMIEWKNLATSLQESLKAVGADW